MKKKVLVFDSEETGHHPEYIHHLVRYAKENSLAHPVTCALHPAVYESVSEGAEVIPDFSVFEIDPSAIDHVQGADTLWKRSVREWELANHLVQQTGADHLLLMTLNWFQIGLLLPAAHQVSYTISGIFFSPYPRWSPEPKTWREYLSVFLKRFRKKTLMWLMMRNANISAVHVLNDPRAADYLNRTIDKERNRFRALPDPVPVLPAPQVGADLRMRYSVEQERTLFLFFGTISRRKGIFRVLDAFEKLPKRVQGKAALLLLGRLKDEQQVDIRKQVHMLKEEGSLQVRTDFRFLEPEELALALQECDVVLAPYQRTEGSSGVIGHAARVGKPVIGPQSGLIGELIRDYELGKALDATHVEEIAKGLTTFVEETEYESLSAHGREEYVRERSPTLFVRTLIDIE